MNWAEKVVLSTEEAESPARFQYWSALAAISAVARKNVVLDRFFYKLYPNIYVNLIARSGLRKGNPVILARKLVESAQCTRVISGRNTFQAILKDLGKAYSTENGDVVKEAHAFLVAGEFSSFLIKDPEALTVLTDLYDTFAHEPEWKNTLKHAGIDRLANPCITLLGASNEEHYRDAVPPNAIGGGFIARTFIIFEEKRRTINDLMDAPKKTPDINDLACYLKELSKIKGEFTIQPEGKALYKQWYKEFTLKGYKDPTGSLERLGDQILKLAMLISLAVQPDLVISEAHMFSAIEQACECIDGMKRVTMGSGRSISAYATSLVLKELITRPDHQVTRRALLTRFWGEFDSMELDRVIETLVQSGGVIAEMRGKDVVLILKREALDEYTKFRGETT